MPSCKWFECYSNYLTLPFYIIQEKMTRWFKIHKLVTYENFLVVLFCFALGVTLGSALVLFLVLHSGVTLVWSWRTRWDTRIPHRHHAMQVPYPCYTVALVLLITFIKQTNEQTNKHTVQWSVQYRSVQHRVVIRILYSWQGIIQGVLDIKHRSASYKTSVLLLTVLLSQIFRYTSLFPKVVQQGITVLMS